MGAKAAGPQLATFVHVADSKGTVHVFGPDDDIPTWAQRAIVNPKAWEGGELPKVRAAAPAKAKDESPAEQEPEVASPEEEAPGAPEAPAAEEQGGEQVPVDDDDQEPAADGDVPVPPRTGPGSGKQAWHDYAKAQGLEISAEATRDEVIEMLEDADLPTEQAAPAE